MYGNIKVCMTPDQWRERAKRFVRIGDKVKIPIYTQQAENMYINARVIKIYKHFVMFRASKGYTISLLFYDVLNKVKLCN